MLPGAKVIVSFFGFISIVTIAGADLRFWGNFTFQRNLLIDYFFPKHPVLLRVRSLNQTNNIGAILDFIGLVERHGYPVEEHYVTTEDGYNLVIHRIPGSPRWKGQKAKGIAFIQHGILSSSDSWVLFGPNKDLPFLLADEGYDVWLGNTRGNTYCRSHIELTTDDEKFWQFSYHEMGLLDLPAMFDYILNSTSEQSLHYIGHSMGTTMLFALLSEKTEYNAKIKLALCLAPVVFWVEVATIVQPLIDNRPILQQFFDSNEIYDIGSLTSSGIVMRRLMCKDGAITQSICLTILFLFSGSDPTQINTDFWDNLQKNCYTNYCVTDIVILQTALPEMMSYYPAGASTQTLLHFYQNVVTKDFKPFNYGLLDNYRRYKKAMPVGYDLGKITAPMAIFYGINDELSKKSSVLHLRKHLRNIVLMEENAHKLMSHMDFIWATNAKTLIYDRLIEVMEIWK